MIAVDTSALMAIVLDEPPAEACVAALESGGELLISAATVTEALIVSMGRNLQPQMVELLHRLDFNIVAVTGATALRVADAHSKWGRGMNPAALNFGDCFAYEIATTHECPLLYIGNDFSRTDVASVL